MSQLAVRPQAPTEPTPEPTPDPAWEPVCPLDRLDRERGVAALVHGRAVAVFRTHADQVHVIDNHDPFVGASVLARGIVGTKLRDGVEVPFVASPMLKHPFDLRTGRCLDDPEVGVPVYAARVVDGMVEVGAPVAR